MYSLGVIKKMSGLNSKLTVHQLVGKKVSHAVKKAQRRLSPNLVTLIEK